MKSLHVLIVYRELLGHWLDAGTTSNKGKLRTKMLEVQGRLKEFELVEKDTVQVNATLLKKDKEGLTFGMVKPSSKKKGAGV